MTAAMVRCRPQQTQESPRLSHGIQFPTPRSLPISSIMVGNHQVTRVAALTKVPCMCMLTLRQPLSQTSNLIRATTLRSVLITG